MTSSRPKGKVGTLAFDFDRQVVEAAAAYMADEDAGIGFLYSGWCQAALPHRRLANDQGWQIDGERVRLIVEPGMRGGDNGKPEPVGVPYGSRARLILLRLQSEALRTQSRDVELRKHPPRLAYEDGHTGRRPERERGQGPDRAHKSMPPHIRGQAW